MSILKIGPDCLRGEGAKGIGDATRQGSYSHGGADSASKLLLLQRQRGGSSGSEDIRPGASWICPSANRELDSCDLHTHKTRSCEQTSLYVRHGRCIDT